MIQSKLKTLNVKNCPSAGFYLDGDLELVQRADVLHQHCNDELMGDTLHNTHTAVSSFVEVRIFSRLVSVRFFCN